MKNKATNIVEEKTVLVYLSLVKKYINDRTKINCSNFIKEWDKIFQYNIDPHQMKVLAHKNAHITFDKKTLEEIQEYRNTLAIYENTEVPEDIKCIAQEKSIIVVLASNQNIHLSGFDVRVKEGKQMPLRINTIPFGLSEKEVRELLQKLPTKTELKKKESVLMNILRNDTIPIEQKKKTVNNYKELYATHNFKIFMNRFTIKQCENKELTLFCVNLCNRCGIANLQNNAPIVYKFCEGSGKRKKTMKRINKARRKVK